MRQGSRVETSGAAPSRDPLGPGPARWKVSREQHRVVRVRGRGASPPRARAGRGRARPTGISQGLTAALQRVCRAATAALGLRGAAVHVMAESEAAGVAACSDAEARAVAELQFTANEGPALGGVPHPAPRARAPARRGPRPLARLRLARAGARRPRGVLLPPPAGRGLLRGPRPVRRPGRTARRRRAGDGRGLRRGPPPTSCSTATPSPRPGSSTRDCPPRWWTGPGSTRRRAW